MLKINIKIALRNLWKRKGFTIINVLGLTAGLSSCILILLFVIYENSYDQFIEENDRIFRMVEHRKSPDGENIFGHVPYSFVGTILNDYPEVESATAFAGPFPNQRVSVINEDGSKSNFLESHVLLADSSFFDVFSLRLRGGNRQTVLREPNSIVLTESTSRKFYGDEDPVGKTILISGRSSIVTGVCQDPPANSHLKFSYLVSSTTVRWFSQEHFNLRYAHCYLKLRVQSHAEELEKKFPDMVETYLAGEIERVNEVSWDEYKKSGYGYSYFLKPLTSIHLDEEIEGGMKAGGNPTILKVLIAVAILIFIIASINFMNLSTARSMERVKEVGVRKVMGSLKIQLIGQFLTESFFVSLISIVMAVGLVLSITDLFNVFFDSAIALKIDWQVLALLACLSVFITLLAGIYPAFVLSSSRPVTALKGSLNPSNKKSWVKNGLLVFQFSISIGLIISTLVFQRQIHFLENKDLGFDKDHLLVIEGTFHMNAGYTQPFLEETRNIPGVKESAGTLWVQGFQGTWSDEYQMDESSPIHSIRRVVIGDGVDKVMDFKMIDGSFFSSREDDENAVLLNEAALEVLAIEEPVGKTISLIEHDEGTRQKIDFKIKGVIKNFNFQSLHSSVEPLVIQSNEAFAGRMSYIVLKLDGQNLQHTMDQLEEKWNEMVPDRPFSYRFLDDTLDMNYSNERNLATIFSLFSGLSILIASIGLLALSAYTISLRSKEIGIRKVIGASVTSILVLLSKSFVKTVCASFVVAAPVVWYAMDYWLQNFAYRINLPIDVFAIAGIGIIAISWVTISAQALKTALTNPIESLRDE